MPSSTHSALVILLGLVACSCGPTITTEERQYTELQSLCASSGNGTDGDTTELIVNVQFATCLSSSCDTLVESSCSLSVEGQQITVDALATVNSQVGGECTSDCGLVEAQCTLEVPNDTYAIAGGGQTLDYEVGAPAACSSP